MNNDALGLRNRIRLLTMRDATMNEKIIKKLKRKLRKIEEQGNK